LQCMRPPEIVRVHGDIESLKTAERHAKRHRMLANLFLYSMAVICWRTHPQITGGVDKR
jgi:hypothetical protein